MIEMKQEAPPHTRQGVPTWLNWSLALLTIPAAITVMVVAFGAVMGVARCTNTTACPHLGPGELWFGILAYGPPFVAVVTIAVSIFTARRRYGFVVPLVGLGLLVVDAAVLMITFRP